MNADAQNPRAARYNHDRFDRFFALFWEVHGPDIVRAWAGARRGDAEDAWVNQRERLRVHANNGTVGNVPNAVEVMVEFGVPEGENFLARVSDLFHDPRPIKI